MKPSFLTSISLLVFSVVLLSPVFGASGMLIPSLPEEWEMLFTLRVPRVLLGLIVGSGLAMSGAVLQSFFRNDLASPYTLGIASTASFGAAIALFFRLPASMVEIAAISFSFVSLMGILGFYRYGRIQDASTLLLIGLAFGLISSSGIFFLQYFGGVERSFEIYRWLTGGLEIVGFQALVLPVLALFVTTAMIWRNIPSLDLLQVGPEFAKGRGVDVQRSTVLVIWTSALLVGIFVSTCGPIGFVGLIIPHVTRRYTGAGHRELLPVCMLLGGGFLVFMDTIARSLFSPIEIPVGIITSLIGGPCFLWLLLRKK
jgi:iron complex transport system permease protein